MVYLLPMLNNLMTHVRETLRMKRTVKTYVCISNQNNSPSLRNVFV